MAPVHLVVWPPLYRPVSHFVIDVYFLIFVFSVQYLNSVHCTLDELHGNGGPDLIFGDYGAIEYDESVQNLHGLRYIMSLNCTEGGGTNVAWG